MEVTARAESWTIRGGFRISRESRGEATVVVVEARRGDVVGRGECVPYARYRETPEGVIAEITAASRTSGKRAIRRETLEELLPAGSARNALDCALWDLEARERGVPAWRLAGQKRAPNGIETMRTVSLGSAEEMAAAAAALRDAGCLKVKVDAREPVALVEAVRAAAPGSALIVDPNESWTRTQLRSWAPRLAELGVALIEQPVAAGADGALAAADSPVDLCADEAVSDRGSLAPLPEVYSAVNIKLDKTGGLTEALAFRGEAARRGLDVMIGCIVGTSLGIAPAMLLARGARYVDLDGPFLLERDRDGALHDPARSLLQWSPDVWGG